LSQSDAYKAVLRQYYIAPAFCLDPAPPNQCRGLTGNTELSDLIEANALELLEVYSILMMSILQLQCIGANSIGDWPAEESKSSSVFQADHINAPVFRVDFVRRAWRWGLRK